MRVCPHVDVLGEAGYWEDGPQMEEGGGVER